MSLINDLLCDLQERKSATAAGYRLSDLQPVPRTAATSRRRLLLPASAILLVAGSVAAWFVSVPPPVAAAVAVSQPTGHDAADDNTHAADASPTASSSAPTLDAADEAGVVGVVGADATAATDRDNTARAAAVSQSEPVAEVVASAPPATRPEPATRAQPDTAVAATAAVQPAVGDVKTKKPIRVAIAKPSPVVRPTYVAPAAATPTATADAPTTSAPSVAAAPVRTAANNDADPMTAGLDALAAGQPARAEKQFYRLVAQRPAEAQTWLHLGHAQALQGRVADAEATLAHALTTVGEPSIVARTLARHMLDRGATREALQVLEAYRPASPLQPEHDAFIAALQQRLGHYDMAVERYRGILALRPQMAAWWVGLAICEEARGNGDVALEAYRHARNIGNLDTRLAVYTDQRIAAMQTTEQS